MELPPTTGVPRSADRRDDPRLCRTYTPCYCEENVFCLLRDIAATAGEESDAGYYAVFVSNHGKAVAVCEQRAGHNPLGAVLWDYHVVAMCDARGDRGAAVLDLDSRLPFPCPLEEYIHAAFPSTIKSDYSPRFRLVPRHTFLRSFSSDRSHMLKEDGTWLAEPPLYPPIQVDGLPGSNLAEFTSMNADAGLGVVLDRDGLLERLQRHASTPADAGESV